MRDVILQGDCLQVLRTLPDESVQCVVTSPPYFGLRDYGVPGQIGLEETPAAYVERLVEVFREVKRVLRRDGVMWLNLGDSYAGSNKGMGTDGKAYGGPKQRSNAGSIGLGKPDWSLSCVGSKQLLGMPWRVAFALQDDGWILRSDVIWHKPNCMPESVRDRPTKSHEYLFLFAKSERYFYDAEAITEPSVDAPGKSRGGSLARIGNDRFVAAHAHRGPMPVSSGYRNKRTVWTIATAPFPGAHFATFPPALVEPCILAGTSPQACEVCGAPWERVTEREPTPDHIKAQFEASRKRTADNTGRDDGHTNSKPHYTRAILGEHFKPTCRCKGNTGAGRCVVFDPFFGAGTVGLVARQHNRHYLGIELNASYITMAEKRIAEATKPRAKILKLRQPVTDVKQLSLFA